MTDSVRSRMLELDDLLLRRATEQLNVEDARRLSDLLTEFPDADTEQYDIPVAAVLLASLESFDPLPESLEEKLRASAADWRRS